MTDRERRLLDAAKAASAFIGYEMYTETQLRAAIERGDLNSDKAEVALALKSSLQEYFGSERQDQ